MGAQGEDRQEEILSDPAGELAVFGREVEIFIDQDPIGQYLVKRAREDIEAAQEGLLEADPEDPKAIRGLQFKAAVANRVRTWLGEAIQNGRAAAAQMQLERDENGA